MNEAYLHHIWKMKRLPFHALQTTDGKSIEIIHIGTHNHDSGPDFFNGQIKIDGVIHSGNIELHLQSSDWFAHKHQNDKSYNNVILHVVFEHNQEVVVESSQLPTIELKGLIDWKHFHQIEQIRQTNTRIPCANLVNDCPSPIFWNQIEHALVGRVERKIAQIHGVFNLSSPDPREVLFYAVAQAFGMKTNAIACEELAQRIPFKRLIVATKQEQEALIFGTSGMLETYSKDAYHLALKLEWRSQQYRLNVHPSQPEIWKFKGCRSAGFPTIRLAQFAAFVSAMDWSSAFWELPSAELKEHLLSVLLVKPNVYWNQHYDFGKQKSKPACAQISKSAANLILINGIVPFLGWLSNQTGNSLFREKAFELLELIPPEANVQINQWKLLGKTPQSASDSQGLIEQLNSWCNQKKCFNCAVGMQLFNRS